jgi:hypothetical protein
MLGLDQVAYNPWGAVVVFFALLITHALGDFAWQGSFLSQAKNRNADHTLFFPKGAPRGLWWTALVAHALIHAGGVWLVTGYVVLAFAELVLHSAIDYAKCEGWISFALDQTLHRICKLIYVALLYANCAGLDWNPLDSDQL